MGLLDILRALSRRGDVNVAAATNVKEPGGVSVDVQVEDGEVLPAREAMSVVNLGDPESLLVAEEPPPTELTTDDRHHT